MAEVKVAVFFLDGDVVRTDATKIVGDFTSVADIHGSHMLLSVRHPPLIAVNILGEVALAAVPGHNHMM